MNSLILVNPIQVIHITLMSQIDRFFERANVLIDRPAPLSPNKQEPANDINPIQLDNLKYITHQKDTLIQNIKQFIQKDPANNVLLRVPRGTGESSLIKTLLNQYKNDGLRLIEVERQHFDDLQDIYRLTSEPPGSFLKTGREGSSWNNNE